jgi:type III restriction enzyme
MSLIINTPFVCPAQHWVRCKGGKLEIKPERRPASYEVFDARNNTKRTEVLDLVNTIRARVDQWREAGWPGVTIVTRKLLEHWHDREARQYPFYFLPARGHRDADLVGRGGRAVQAGHRHSRRRRRVGAAVQQDGHRQRQDHGDGDDHHLAGAERADLPEAEQGFQPRRVHRGARPDGEGTAAGAAAGRGQLLRRVQPVPVRGAAPEAEPGRGADRELAHADAAEGARPLGGEEGPGVDEAFTRRVLGKLATHKDIIVINDEAHHAYRKPPEVKISKKHAEEQGIDLDEATRWIEGLDRIHKTRRIQRCFDLSATPFAPTGQEDTDTALFDWIISDFGLNDAIEAGLVKTPRVVVRDDAVPDAKTLRSKLYHLYRDPIVAEDLNRKAEPHEALPKLVQDAYTLLGADWRGNPAQWQEPGTFAAGHADGLQPHRDRGAHRALFQQGRCALARTARADRTLAGRFQGAGEGRDRRDRDLRQGLRGG